MCTAVAVVALGAFKIVQGVFRGLHKAATAKGATMSIESKSRKVWLHVKMPWAKHHHCPHCESPIDAEHELPLCPQCYGDLQHPCPGCGDAVAVHRKSCPTCRADLRSVRQS